MWYICQFSACSSCPLAASRGTTEVERPPGADITGPHGASEGEGAGGGRGKVCTGLKQQEK